MRVVRNVAVEVSLARLTRSEFDHVDIRFHHRDATAQVEQLLTTCHPRRIEAARVYQDVYPLLRGEFTTPLDVLIQIDDAHLERGESGNFKWSYLLIVNLCFIVSQVDGSPHPTGQEHRILPDYAFGDIDEILVDRRDAAPVFVFRFDQSRL